MTTDGRREVEQLHAFFEAWFKGTLPRTPEAFARFVDVTAPGFHLVTPQGRILAKAKLETMLEGAFERLLHFAADRGVSHRTAALCLGVGEVAEVKKKRGLFP